MKLSAYYIIVVVLDHGNTFRVRGLLIHLHTHQNNVKKFVSYI